MCQKQLESAIPRPHVIYEFQRRGPVHVHLLNATAIQLERPQFNTNNEPLPELIPNDSVQNERETRS
jgi:hypothetical protein